MMKASWCILTAFALAVAIPSPAEAHSPILTVLKSKKKKLKKPMPCVPAEMKKCPTPAPGGEAPKKAR